MGGTGAGGGGTGTKSPTAHDDRRHHLERRTNRRREASAPMDCWPGGSGDRIVAGTLGKLKDGGDPKDSMSDDSAIEKVTR